MKLRRIVSCLVPGLLTGAVVLAAPDDRFLGGSFDGYARGTLHQYVSAASARFAGGARDGYGSGFLHLYDAATSPQQVSPRFAGGARDGYGAGLLYLYDAATSPQRVSPRFGGGVRDGYDAAFLHQYAAATSPQRVSPRFTGGRYDGYARDGAEGLVNPLNFDTDADGLVDWWEVLYSNNLAVLRGNGDHDGDGATESDEMEADTDPTRSHSVFRITAIEATDSVGVVFACTNSRAYSLGSTLSLITGAWSPIAGQTNVPGQAGGTMVLVDTNAAGFGIYRVLVTRP
jgi:hypothetical protein